ncbi:craniofacial development protein 2-like [Ostrea edulis]|uniref:craniofacial development protein 2-like n=1 Tax=Ostrea edulis TaxID=37623 RepID=UPI0024AE97B8|nr:craniofacial development protein 2-like [Ostrea edulis]
MTHLRVDTLWHSPIQSPAMGNQIRCEQCRTIKGKDSKYKLSWIVLVKLVVGQRVLSILSVYAPQSGLNDVQKDQLYDQLRAVTVKIPASDFLIPCGDWSDHVGSIGTEFREVHGGLGYGRPDPDTEGERILEYALAFDLVVGNICFKKRDSHLTTYKSGGAATQIDFILFRKNKRKLVTDVKVIPGEEVALQHQLLVCDILIDMPTKAKYKFTPRLKV